MGNTFDNIIITASCAAQADSYVKKIKQLQNIHSLPDTNFIIFPDKDNARVGSGGSTLDFIKKHFTSIIGTKSLLIHSGGDSKRIPQYSACGKLFSPILRLNQYGYPEILLNELLRELELVFKNTDSGLIISSGDVLISDPLEISEPAADNSSFVCSLPAPSHKGCAHGVFCSDSNGLVQHFLHKCSEDVLLSHGAIDDGYVNIDTGVMYVNDHLLRAFYDLVEDDDFYALAVNDETCLNLYGDIIYPLARCSTIDDYLNQKCELSESKNITECRKILFSKLHSFPIYEKNIGHSFIHFGTSKELLHTIKNKAVPGSQHNVNCNLDGDYLGYNSYCSPHSSIEGYVENSCILDNVHIGKNSIVCGTMLNNISIPDNTIVSTLKIGFNHYCVRIYPIDFDPKMNNEWDNCIYPIVDRQEDCSDAIRHFLSNDPEYLSCPKSSFKQSSALAQDDYSLENKITEYKSNYYLNTLTTAPESITEHQCDKASVVTNLPVRVNFAGGWTDTPPYFNEYGGAVINAAIKIDGDYPIECSVKKRSDNRLVFISKDLKLNKTISSIDDLFQLDDDRCIIHQAALVATGVINRNTDLTALMKMTGGFSISTGVKNLPKGTGLGTNSILCAGVARSIFEFFAIPYDDKKVYTTVLKMEQMMKTGGGWQDQIGGYIPGIKYISCPPGNGIALHIDPIDIGPSLMKQLNERYLLIYTGQSRLARNLLSNVMHNVFYNDAAKRAIVDIKILTDKMRTAIQSQNIDQMAELFNLHFELSKQLYSGTSNKKIEDIINCIKNYTDGIFICGAGGGGFLQVILKKGCSKADIQAQIEKRYKSSPEIAVYNTEFII